MPSEELIRLCAVSNDGAAWEEFVTRFQRPISLSILRIARQYGEFSAPIVDDLIQETYLKLCANRCRQLLEFADQHPEAVVGYVKTIAVNVARDHFKSLHSQKRGSGEVSQISGELDARPRPSLSGGHDSLERALLIAQINRCLESCAQDPDRERDCIIFWLYYRQGLSAREIATLPNVRLSAKGVESAILRLTRAVRAKLVKSHRDTDLTSKPPKKGLLDAESF